MHRNPPRFILLLFLLLAGCASATPTAHATATPTSPPTATPTPATVQSFHLSIPPAIDAAAAYVLDPNSLATIYALNSDTPLPMASTTKIMTAYVALKLGNLDQVVTINSDIQQYDNGVDSIAGLKVGEKYTLHDLLYALLLPSGADAAVMIADTIAGSEPSFVVAMNAMAASLGLRHTHYVNETGLDAPGHATSAHDLAELSAYAMRLQPFREIVATMQYTIPANASHPPLVLQNTNELLGTGNNLGIDGIKTGYTGNARYCVVVDARHDDRELIVVILNVSSPEKRFSEADDLLVWGFALQPVPTN